MRSSPAATQGNCPLLPPLVTLMMPWPAAIPMNTPLSLEFGPPKLVWHGVCCLASCERTEVMTGDFSFSESDVDYDDDGIQLDDTAGTGAHAQNERRDVARPPTSTIWPGQKLTASKQVPAAGATCRVSAILIRCFTALSSILSLLQTASYFFSTQ